VQRAGPGAGGEPEPARAAGMLALHGIFTLVTRHGLEYPRFYERLYSCSRRRPSRRGPGPYRNPNGVADAGVDRRCPIPSSCCHTQTLFSRECHV